MAQQLKTDWTLFFVIVLMVCFGIVMVFSASTVMAEVKGKGSTYFVLRQAGWAFVGFVSLMYFKRKSYSSLSEPMWAFAPLGIVLGLLVVVYFADSNGHRWLRLGGFSLQPSEFAKPALVVFLAWFVTRRAHAINTKHTLWPAALAMGVLAISVIVADIGTTAVLMITAAAIFYVAGLERQYLFAALGICLLMIPMAILSKPYRVHRLIGYLDPDYKILDKIDPKERIKNWANQSITTRDASYQARQSKIAVATGGVMGKGLMESKQKLLFLPEAHNDFLFAVIGEELGLWGAAIVLSGYILILWRGYRLFWSVSDDFGRYLALGVTTAIVAQALINMSVVLDMAPTKGFTLPLISYGGSSLLSSLSSLGILLSVSDHAG